VTTVVHACPEDLRFRTLCREPIQDGEGLSCFAQDWTCKRCVRLQRLLVQVEKVAHDLNRWDDVRTVLAAVTPDAHAICLLDEAEARRVLSVLRLLDARGGGRGQAHPV